MNQNKVRYLSKFHNLIFFFHKFVKFFFVITLVNYFGKFKTLEENNLPWFVDCC